jgi:hypothetical protein
MAHDLANAIIHKTQENFNNALLNVHIALCKDREFDQLVDCVHKPFFSFNNVIFETHQDIGTFQFSLDMSKYFHHKGFVFKEYDKAINMFMYQYIMHALYAVDLFDYEVVILSFQDAGHQGTDEKIQFCLHLNLSDIPSTEVDSISTEILDKITEPIHVIFEAWRDKYKTL